MIRQALFALLLLLPLAACNSPLQTPVTNQVAGVVAGVGVVRLEKHYEVQCSIYYILEEGSYCVSKYKPTGREEVHCFKTLGGVDCYSERDPYMLAGRNLPAAPRALADPAMPAKPPVNRLEMVLDRFEHLTDDEFEQRRSGQPPAAQNPSQQAPAETR